MDSLNKILSVFKKYILPILGIWAIIQWVVFPSLTTSETTIIILSGLIGLFTLVFTIHLLKADKWIEKVDDELEDGIYPNPELSRVEVIDENGRSYTKWNCSVELSYQDNGKTLKIFLKPKTDKETTNPKINF